MDIRSEFDHIRQNIATTSRNVEDFTGQITSEIAGLVNVTATYQNAASMDLSSILQSTQSLAEQGTKEDASTGLTPRKGLATTE